MSRIATLRASAMDAVTTDPQFAAHTLVDLERHVAWCVTHASDCRSGTLDRGARPTFQEWMTMAPQSYLHQTFRTQVPEWLANFDPQNPGAVSDLVRSFLNSRIVFYPGAGQDGSPVQVFNEAEAAHCFLYLDYMITRDAIEHELQHRGFKGYSPIARLAVSESDMRPTQWTAHLRPDEVQYPFQPVPPYAFMEILEKGDDAVGGASRLVILFLAADAHAAYDALFCQQDSGPTPFAIVLQDHGTGLNWSDFGADGAMETIARRSDTFPTLLLVGDNTKAWEGFTQVEDVDPIAITAMCTRRLYARDFDRPAERNDNLTLRGEALPDLIFDCPVVLSDHYEVPVDDTHWPAPFNYHSPGKGQTPHRPRAPFRTDAKALRPGSQMPHFDANFGVYMLAIDHPRKAFYVGIAAADSRKPEGVGSRIRKHRVKLTASHVGRSLACGSPAGAVNVDHTGGWRPFAVERYQHYLAAGINDCCPDVRLMVGSAGDNVKVQLKQFEDAIQHNTGAIRSRIFDILWPGENNSDVEILNTVKGRAPDSLPGAIILPKDCPNRDVAYEVEDGM